MKLRNLFFSLGTVVAIGSPSFATGSETPVVRKSAFAPLEQQLGSQLYTPARVGHGKPQVIELRFKVRNDFSMEIQHISGGSKAMQRHLRQSLEKATFYIDRENVGKSYLVRLNFH